MSDSYEADELTLYMDNTEQFYRRIQCCYLNLARKVKRGVYDPTKAPKLFQYAVDDAARAYRKECGPGNFPKPVRVQAAESYAKEFNAALESGRFDDLGAEAADVLGWLPKPRTQRALGQDRRQVRLP